MSHYDCYHGSTSSGKTEHKQPPLGLTPKWIMDEHRLQEIHNAIMRYKQAHKEIPSEWIQEYISLCNV